MNKSLIYLVKCVHSENIYVCVWVLMICNFFVFLARNQKQVVYNFLEKKVKAKKNSNTIVDMIWFRFQNSTFHIPIQLIDCDVRRYHICREISSIFSSHISIFSYISSSLFISFFTQVWCDTLPVFFQ